MGKFSMEYDFFLRCYRSAEVVPPIILNRLLRLLIQSFGRSGGRSSGNLEVTSLLLVALGFLCHLSWRPRTVVLQVLWGIWLPFVFLLSHELGNICVAYYLNSSGMIAILYLDVNAFVFFISQPDWVYFYSLSFVAGARGCLEGGQGNICVLQGRKQEPNRQVPVQPLQMWPQRDIHPFFSWRTLTFGDRRKYKMKV